MIFKSIIKANESTPNKRIYTFPDMVKIMEYLMKMILRNKLYVWFGVKPEQCIDSNIENVVGYVYDIDLIDGQLVFKINMLENIQATCVSYICDLLYVDLLLEAKIKNETDNNGNNFVDLSEFDIRGVRLIKYENNN